MAKISVNFAEARRRSRDRITQALTELRRIEETVKQLGLPSEDPETGLADRELKDALNCIGALEALMNDQLYRNREPRKGP
jgi:hypothetical protein